MLLYFLLCLMLQSTLFGYNKMQVSSVIKASKTNQPFNASGCDFQGTSTLLQNTNFKNCQLSRANFASNGNIVTAKAGTIKIANQITDLTGCNFSNAIVRAVSFAKCILKNTIWNNADIAYADFSNADLTGSNISSAKNIHLAKFCNAIMPDGTKCSGKTWKGKKGKIINCHCPSKK